MKFHGVEGVLHAPEVVSHGPGDNIVPISNYHKVASYVRIGKCAAIITSDYSIKEINCENIQ